MCSSDLNAEDFHLKLLGFRSRKNRAANSTLPRAHILERKNFRRSGQRHTHRANKNASGDVAQYTHETIVGSQTAAPQYS